MTKKLKSHKQALFLRKDMHKHSRASVSVLAGLSISILAFSSVEALNVGQARTQSYLGQPLSIFVPIDDSGKLINLNQLIVTKPSSTQLNDLNVPQASIDLSYEVVSNGAEKGILIKTLTPFNEPYVDVGVKVDYQGVSQLSKFTVLIDLEPISLRSELNQTAAVSSGIGEKSPEALVSKSTDPSQIIGIALKDTTSVVEKASLKPITQQITYNSEIMGPYDWAEKNLIPEKFGPVLEGQSLWRVARRINKAMGVSIDQMMWALYRANPQAFSGSNVATLKSGSILSIPQETFVREVTELGAVRLLNPEVVAVTQNIPIIQVIEEPTVIDTSPKQVIKSQITTEAESIEIEATDTDVQLSAEVQEVNESAALEPVSSAEKSILQLSQDNSIVSLSRLDVIDDLKSEIAYLNQQVTDQGRRIENLEQRLATTQLNTSVLAVSNDGDSEAGINISDTSGGDELSANTVESESVAAVDTVVPTAVIAAPVANTITTDNAFSVKSWSLGALALFLLGFAYFTRHKLVPVFLKFFGGRYEYDDEESFLDSVSKKRKPLRPLYESDTAVVATESKNAMSSKKQSEQDEFEDYSFFIDDDALMDVEELSFTDRIKQLIESGDFEEAKNTVKFASEANVNEHDINVYLLKIFAAQSDRVNFDILFDKIHANIDQYDDEAQLMVAEIQAEMSIGKVINFSSGPKKMAS